MKSKTVEKKVLRYFQEFGSHMQIVAILSVLSFVFPFVGLIILAFVFLALGDIRRIYREMPNPDLMEFRSKYIISFITSLFGLFMMITGVITMIMLIFGLNFQFFFPSIMPMIIMFIIGIVVLFISGIMQYSAWNSLSKFFEENKSIFPESVAQDALKGSNNIKHGIILTMTIILAIFGVILMLVGYFQLASLKKINDEYSHPIIAQPQKVSPYAQTQMVQVIQKTPGQIRNFCTQCGAKIESIASFCHACGVSLKK